MAFYQSSFYGDSPCDDHHFSERCEHCDDTVKFYDDKMKSIKTLLHPIIRHLRGIQQSNPELIEVYLEELMEECEFQGWEYQILKAKEETK